MVRGVFQPNKTRDITGQKFGSLKEGFMKNGDAIRAMTDEELADWLGVYCNGQTAQEVGKPCVSGMGSCEECWLDWLKQEVDTDGN